MHLLTQERILKLSEELDTSRQKISSLEQVVQPPKKKRRKARDQEKTRAIGAQKTAELKSSALPRIAFGKAEWGKYFGEIGAEPPLPTNIEKILSGPCPIWEGKRVEDTHMLVLIPKTVNGKPLTLNTLKELIERPRGGGHATKYRYYDSYVKKELGDVSAPRSHWVLMTKDVLPGSRNKSYSDQCALVKRHKHYGLPHPLEATASILMHYVRTGDRLYTDRPSTYTRCQEKVKVDDNDNQWPLAIGGFSSGGLSVTYHYGSSRDGVAGVRNL